eukprot:EG_transcript_11877
MQVARQRNITLRVFYHTSTWRPYWPEIVTEQVLLMDGRRPANFFLGEHPHDQGPRPCGDCPRYGGLRWLPTQWASVLDLADQLYLNVARQGPGDFERVKQLVEGLPLVHRDKVFFHFNHTVQRQKDQEMPANASELSVAEVSTMMAMHDHCVAERAAGRKAFVLFLHSKGACCSRTAVPAGPIKPGKQKAKFFEHASVASWRELMNTFSVEFPSICLRALLDGYVACGANLKDDPGEVYDPHFSGTVFWANCDHFAALPPLGNRFDGWAPELWPFNVSLHYRAKQLFALNCAFNAHRCRKFLYFRPCWRATYRAKVLDYLRHSRLPTSDVATRDTTPAWVRQNCHPLFAQPYINASFWANVSAFPFEATRPSDFDRHLPARFSGDS